MGSNKYRYTVSGYGILTEEQRQGYEETGFVLIRNLVSPELLDETCQRFRDICNGLNVPSSGILTVMKDQSLKNTGVKGEFLINKVQDFLFDDVLFKYAADKNVVDVVKSIVGPNITAAHSMFINKPPDANPEGSLHPLHQDLHYFPFRPADRVVASWTAVEHIDQQNGGLYVIPGSHRSKLYPHSYPKGFKNAFYHGVQGFDHFPKLHLEMEKGDTVFFHPLLLHGSGPNYTKGFRKAISCHYADSNCNFIDVKGTGQEIIAREVEQLTAKKGAPTSFANVWKLKSRLVAGSPGNFQEFDSNL